MDDLLKFEEKEISGWSRTSSSNAKVFNAKNLLELKKIISFATKNNLSICPIGAGYSYGDEIQNNQNIVLSTARMNNIINWDPINGILVGEPGVTLNEILKICLIDSWILPVVPGIRFPTIGGCTANNVHGKNSYKNGNFGDWVREFDIMLASGQIINCSREKNSELFYSGIAGIGMLGIFTKITLQLKRTPHTNLYVRKWTVPNLEKMIKDILISASNCEYVIGQIDCFKKGKKLGRGTIHAAFHTKDNLSKNSYISDLEIPERVFSIFPASWFLKLGKIFISSFTMRLISNFKYFSDFFNSYKDGHTQSFPKFNFLLDRIPNWPAIFKHGFYEFEPLIPIKSAEEVIREIIKISHRYKLPAYLSGIKLHKKDRFLLSYALDGFSVGFDFPVIQSKKRLQEQMFDELHELIIDAKGLVYLAKDNIMKPHHISKMYGHSIDKYIALKHKYDPEQLFQSNMYRRLFINN